MSKGAKIVDSVIENDFMIYIHHGPNLFLQLVVSQNHLHKRPFTWMDNRTAPQLGWTDLSRYESKDYIMN